MPAFGESAVEFGEKSRETAGGVGVFWGNCGKGSFFPRFPFRWGNLWGETRKYYLLSTLSTLQNLQCEANQRHQRHEIYRNSMIVDATPENLADPMSTMVQKADGQPTGVPLLGLDKDCLLLPHRAVDFQIAKIEKQPRSQFLWLTIYRP